MGVHQVMERIYAINQLIDLSSISAGLAIHAQRFYVGENDITQLPSISAIPRGATHIVYGDDNRITRRNYDIIVQVASWQAGTGVQDVSLISEQLTDIVLGHYASRPRLELNGDALAEIYDDVWIGSDSGLTYISDGIAAITFTLEVSSEHKMER